MTSCFAAGCTDNTTGANCMQDGTVQNPGSNDCTNPPCFCKLGYNPVFDASNNRVTCAEAECNPLVAASGQCACQYTAGSVSYDMANCKCSAGFAPANPFDGTCNEECDASEDYCKATANVITDCTGSGCECRPGYTPFYDSTANAYKCEPYECKEGDTGCICSHPGDVSTCSCSGTITVGTSNPVTVSFVGNKYAFPGYCRPQECSPTSDSNCACIDSSLAETCYCKPGYAIDYQYNLQLTADIANSLDVSSYFSTSCKGSSHLFIKSFSHEFIKCLYSN